MIDGRGVRSAAKISKRPGFLWKMESNFSCQKMKVPTSYCTITRSISIAMEMFNDLFFKIGKRTGRNPQNMSQLKQFSGFDFSTLEGTKVKREMSTNL